MSVVRAAKIALTLPASATEENAGEVQLAIVDERSRLTGLTTLLSAPSGSRVVVVAPIDRPDGRGLVSRLAARLRGLAPVELRTLCEALRRAGVVRVRIIDVDGALGLAVVSGEMAPA